LVERHPHLRLLFVGSSNIPCREAYDDPADHPRLIAADPAEVAAVTGARLKGQFRGTPIVRAGKQGMLRNLALAAAGR